MRARAVLVGLFAIALAAMALAVVVAGGRASSDGKQRGGTSGDSGERSFAEQFADPPSSVRPHAYWWLPDPSVISADGVERDIEAMAEAGIGGVLPFRVDFTLFEDEHGHELLRTALETAKRHAMSVDLSATNTGGGTGGSVPIRIGRPDVDAQELVYGTAVLNAGETFRGVLPPPSVGDDVPTRPRSLVAVVAARCTSGCQTAKPVLLDQDSLVDLTDSVRDDEVEWTAPAGAGQWVLISFWRRGSGLVHIDHLSAAAARAVTDHLDEHVLTPEIKALLDAAGGTLTEDNFHQAGYHLWTRDFLGVPQAAWLFAAQVPAREHHRLREQPQVRPRRDA
jgi:hypothetical protein